MLHSTFWLTFLAAAFAISITPGPDLIYVVSRTIHHGRRYGFCSSLGVATGAVVYVVLVAFGLAAILSTSLLAFTIVKILGAVYLIYLGLRSIFSKRKGDDVTFQVPAKGETSPWMAYKRGVLVDLLNPKTAVFFMAFLPQFTRPDAGSFALQIMFLGILVILIGLLVEATVILVTNRLARMLLRRTNIADWTERLMGSVLIGLGVYLAFSSYRD